MVAGVVDLLLVSSRLGGVKRIIPNYQANDGFDESTIFPNAGLMD